MVITWMSRRIPAGSRINKMGGAQGCMGDCVIPGGGGGPGVRILPLAFVAAYEDRADDMGGLRINKVGGVWGLV